MPPGFIYLIAMATKKTKTKEVEFTAKVKKIKVGPGRPPGVPNKVTTLNKIIINELLDDYQKSGLMSKDFLALEPRDRMAMAERLMQYVMPKMQSTSIDFKAEETTVTIEQKLKELAGESEQ